MTQRQATLTSFVEQMPSTSARAPPVRPSPAMVDISDVNFDDDEDAQIAAAIAASLKDQQSQSLASSAGVVDDARSYPGLDVITARTWIYPSDMPERSYQFNMASKALTKNTLVALPTGLGKTLIAAVVMFNYYRYDMYDLFSTEFKRAGGIQRAKFCLSLQRVH
jgi:hypothetical protein